MFIGKNKNTGQLVDIEDAIKTINQEYVCPVCGEDLVIKNGSIVTPHFAHKTGADCDTFTHDMSEWHKKWQELFPIRNREHVETLEITVEEYLKAAILYKFERPAMKKLIQNYQKSDIITLKHRADIRACGYVIEIQNSQISREEFNERNWFYQAIGCTVIWIFNKIDLWKSDRIEFDRYINARCCNKIYRWKHASKTFVDFIPQCYFFSDGCKFYNVSEDNRNIIVFFQTHEFQKIKNNNDILNQVIWAKYDKGKTSFKEFGFYNKVFSPQKFFQAVLAQEI